MNDDLSISDVTNEYGIVISYIADTMWKARDNPKSLSLIQSKLAICNKELLSILGTLDTLEYKIRHGKVRIIEVK